MNTAHEWLASLKVGDQVIVDGGRSGRDVDIVGRLTPTQIVLTTSSRRFLRKSGRQVNGDKWYPWFLRPATPELIQTVQRESLRRAYLRRIAATRFEALDNETLRQIYDILMQSLSQTIGEVK